MDTGQLIEDLAAQAEALTDNRPAAVVHLLMAAAKVASEAGISSKAFASQASQAMTLMRMGVVRV